MAPPLIQLKEVSLGFGSKQLFAELSLSIGENDRIALVGRNGTGKSSLLKVIADQIEPDHGERILAPGTSIAYLSQNPQPDAKQTVRDYVGEGLPHSGKDDWHKVDVLLAEVGLTGDEDCGRLSGGELRRASIARVMVSEPDLLLLDEPTNHLDLPAIEWLEQKLAAWRGAIMIISHDRTFLGQVTNACLWLSGAQIRRFDKGFRFFDDWVDEQMRLEEEARHKRSRQIERENRWLSKGVTARRKRNQGRLKRLMEMREERARDINTAQSINASAQTSKVSGKQVIRARRISKTFGDKVLFKDFSTIIRRKDRIGIIGPNGAGKTTLIKTLLGEIEPDEGTVRLGTNLDILRIDQKRIELEESLTCREVLTGGNAEQIMVHGEPRNVAAYMKDFLFDGAQIESPVSSLSGGERNRLLLAKAFARKTNLIVLDEPTNDLDMETLDLLENILADFDGTVIIISHDRSFLDHLVTSIIAFEVDENGDSIMVEHAGGYSDYLARRAVARASTETSPSKPKQEKLNKPTERAKKLSYKHQRALDVLPKEIDALGTQIARLEGLLADPNLFTSNRDKYDKICTELDTARASLAEKEENWLEVEMMREEIEG